MFDSVYHTSFNNGFQLCIVPSTQALTTATLMIDAGSNYDPNNNYGLAHFVEHMLMSTITDNGPWFIDASTLKNGISIISHSLGNQLNIVLNHYKEVLTTQRFNADLITKEKEIVSQEILKRSSFYLKTIEDDIDFQLFGPQYGHSVLGNLETVSCFQIADIVQFINNNITPINMALVVVSPIAKEEILAIAYDSFANMNNRARTFIFKEESAQHTAFTTFLINQDTAINAIGIKIHANDEKERFIYHYIAFLLGGETNNNLLTALLRDKLGLVYNVSAVYRDYSSCGKLLITYYCKKDDVDRCKEEIIKLLQNLSHLNNDVEWNKFLINLYIKCNNVRYVSTLLGQALLHRYSIDSLSSLLNDHIEDSEILNLYNKNILNTVSCTRI